MINLLNRKQYFILAALIAAALVLVTLGNLQIVKNYTAGYDFLTHWQGARFFFSNGVSPYSDQATAEIMLTIRNANPEANVANYRFLLPLFSIIFYGPLTILKNASVATALWMTIIEFVLLATGLSIFRMGNWKKTLFISILLLIYMMLSYPSFTALLNGNLVIISIALIVLAVKAIRDGNDEAAGLMLGFSFVKPDAVILILIFIIVWAVTQKRYRILYWFFGLLILLFGFTILLIPDWPVQYIKTVLAYSFNNPVIGGIETGTVVSSSLATRFLIVRNVIIGLILLLEWFFVKTTGFKRFFWLVGITLAFTSWTGAHTPGDYLISSLPGLFFGFELLSERWKSKSDNIIAGLIIILFVAQWIVSGLFSTGSSELFPEWILQGLIPGVTLILLYWSRWWVLHGKKFSEPNQYINL